MSLHRAKNTILEHESRTSTRDILGRKLFNELAASSYLPGGARPRARRQQAVQGRRQGAAVNRRAAERTAEEQKARKKQECRDNIRKLKTELAKHEYLLKHPSLKKNNKRGRLVNRHIKGCGHQGSEKIRKLERERFEKERRCLSAAELFVCLPASNKILSPMDLGF